MIALSTFLPTDHMSVPPTRFNAILRDPRDSTPIPRKPGMSRATRSAVFYIAASGMAAPLAAERPVDLAYISAPNHESGKAGHIDSLQAMQAMHTGGSSSFGKYITSNVRRLVHQLPTSISTHGAPHRNHTRSAAMARLGGGYIVTVIKSVDLLTPESPRPVA